MRLYGGNANKALEFARFAFRYSKLFFDPSLIPMEPQFSPYRLEFDVPTAADRGRHIRRHPEI